MDLEMNHIERVLSEIESRIGQEEDLAYWSYHRKRYARSANSILRAIRPMNPEGIRILDIGSHYLHLSSVLSELGFSVFGTDVEEFAESELSRNRAEAAGIGIKSMRDGLETGLFPYDDQESFDLILLTETLEHLAFRPDRMWSGIFSLLRPKGQVYLTTPNALSLRRIPLQILRLLSLRGYGPNFLTPSSRPILQNSGSPGIRGGFPLSLQTDVSFGLGVGLFRGSLQFTGRIRSASEGGT